MQEEVKQLEQDRLLNGDKHNYIQGHIDRLKVWIPRAKKIERMQNIDLERF